MITYQIALSFAGEQRPLVSIVADRLASALGRDKIFYDRFHEAELARPNLDIYLQEIYHDRSQLVVVFLGADYEHKEWPGLEWRAVRDLIKRKSSERIMLIRVDAGEVAGVFGIDGWLDAEGRSPAEIADRILERLRLLDASPGSSKPRPDSPAHTGVTTVPSPPPHYLLRTEALAALKARLLAPDTARLGITSPRKAVGVQGMGGIGKSVLAAALAQDKEVKAAFPDGIFWVAVGQQPDLIRFQVELAVAVGEPRPVLESPQQGKLLLSRLFAERAVLLVLDDVWNLDHATALNVLSPRGRLLITTRDTELLVGLGAEEYRVEVLDPESALFLLADWAGQEVKDLPPEADRVARECGYLPLALAMIGAMVRLRPTAWSDALDRLRRADLAKIRRNFPDYPYPDLLRAIEVSVEALEPEERTRYLELAVFPEDAAIPEATLETLWAAVGLDAADARDLAAKLVARSLAQRDADGRLRLHDLQADYLRHEVGDLRSLHSRLVDAYVARCPEGFFHGPNDGYFFQHLALHLLGAGRLAELRDLLLTYPWIEAKLATTDVNALLSDYDTLAEDPELRLIQGALRLSAHALLEAAEELPGQLQGRLLGRTEEGIARLLAGTRPSRSQPWLRPLNPSLTPPGGPLVRILTGHSGAVNAVAVLADGRIVSASLDRTLLVWDVNSGKILQTLKGHWMPVNAVAVLPDGHVVSASNDDTLRIWDIDSGKTLLILEGHTRRVNAVAVLPNGCVVSASNDHTLRLWDVASGRTLLIFEGHSRGVRSVAVLTEGRIISASDDDTLRVWDIHTGKSLLTLEQSLGTHPLVALLKEHVVSTSHGTLHILDIDSGKILQAFEGHSHSVTAVAALPKGHLVSASFDHTLRVWDVESGRALQVLEGHSDWIFAVAVLPDGRIVSASKDRTLRVWDVDTRKALQGHEGHSEPVKAVAVLPDGHVASVAKDLRIWDIAQGKTLQTYTMDIGGFNSVLALPDGRVVSVPLLIRLLVVDVASGEARPISGRTKPSVETATALPDGRVVLATTGRSLEIWDIDTDTKLQEFDVPSWVRSVAALSDRLVVAASDDRTVRILDVDSEEVIQTLEGHSAVVLAVAVLPDGRIVSGSKDCTLRVWESGSGKTLQILKGHSRPVQAVAVLSGCHVVSASSDRTLRVWNLKDGQSVARLTLDAEPTVLAPMAAPGRFVVGDATGHVYLLSLEPATGAET